MMILLLAYTFLFYKYSIIGYKNEMALTVKLKKN